MEVYFLNAVRPSRLVILITQKQGGGAIINISTFAAFEPNPVFPTSGVMRAGLAAFTKLIVDKYAAENIRMNNVLPGFLDRLPEKGRIPLNDPDGPLRQLACRNRKCRGLSGFGWRSLHFRSEYPD